MVCRSQKFESLSVHICNAMDNLVDHSIVEERVNETFVVAFSPDDNLEFHASLEAHGFVWNAYFVPPLGVCH